MTPFKWEEAYLESFGETQLFHIARNEATKFEYRVQALELMLKRGYASAKHVELGGLVEHIKHPIVPEIIQSEPVEESGALKASVTTFSLSEEPELLVKDKPVRKMDNKKIAPANEATTPEPTDTEKELTPNEQ